VSPCYDVPKSYQPATALNPSELYDVPKSQLPIYTSASLVRSKKHGSDAVSLRSTGSSNRVSSASSSAQSTSSSESSFPVRLRFPQVSPSRSDSPIYANEESLQDLERRITSATSSISPLPPQHSVLGDPDTEVDYDVPRGALVTSRPPSSVPASSMSGSRGCVSVATSESKESLELYDVPRSVKNCVSIFENKYDHVQHRLPSSSSNHRRDPSKRSSISSTASSSNGSNNPQSAIDRHFGVILRNAGSLRNADSICSNQSKNGSTGEPYDVPPPRASRNGSLRSWSASTSSNLDQSFYDMPAGFSREVSLCGSSETLSCQDNLRGGASSTHPATAAAGGSQSIPAEVKILPLSPKAAVTVCEKLRQEVITSINSILTFVKPKWRVKENLREIMPELRFGCVRLNLGVKVRKTFSIIKSRLRLLPLAHFVC